MAKYGLDLYGTALYGDPDPTIYNAQPFVGTERDYGVIDVSWRKPGGTWSLLRLVRNYFGHPVESDDGTILVDGNANVVSFFRDTTVASGLWVYYSLFVFIDADDDWYRVGYLAVYSPNSYGGPSSLYDRLPRIYRGDFSSVVSTDPAAFPVLFQYLSLMGFQADVLRNLANSVLDLDDPYAMDYDLVPHRMHEFGIPGTVQVIGPLSYKQYLNSCIYLWKTKGTAPCIQAITSIIMGCDCTIQTGTNLLWTSDLSDFVGGIGEWGAFLVNATVAWAPLNPSDFVGGVTPALVMTATATASNVTVGFVSTANVPGLGIPVTAGITYTAQAFIRSQDTANEPAYLRLLWYDATGAFLSNSAGVLVSTLQNVSSPIGVTGVAPAGAVYMALIVTVVAAAAIGRQYYVTSVQVNVGSTVQPHQFGRDLQILLEDGGLTASQIAIRESRLRDILVRYLPLGATYTLVHGVLPVPRTVLSPDVILH